VSEKPVYLRQLEEIVLEVAEHYLPELRELNELEKKRRDRIKRQLTAHMKHFGSKDVWGETFNPWANPKYGAKK
jgi:hypothetical protein